MTLRTFLESAFLVAAMSALALPAIAQAGGRAACDVVLASKQCVRFVGTWKAPTIGKELNRLEVRPPDARRETFPFTLHAVMGGSSTFIDGTFTLNQDIGLYTDEQPEPDAKMRCSLVFIPLSTRRMRVERFGDCVQGHGAYPDGIYTLWRPFPNDGRPSSSPDVAHR